LLEKVLSGVKHVRLDMTARDKGAPDKGHTTLFSSSKVVHYFPNFRSYFGMEYEQPWNMGKILLEIYGKNKVPNHQSAIIITNNPASINSYNH
jgi:hypothetical protein